MIAIFYKILALVVENMHYLGIAFEAHVLCVEAVVIRDWVCFGISL